MSLANLIAVAPSLPTWEQIKHAVTTQWLATIVAIIVALVLWRLIDAGVERFYARRFTRFIPRLSTFKSLSKSLFSFIILTLLAVELLHIWSVNVAPALWSATLISAIVAFGSQTIVHDVLSGIFFLFEDSFDVGDGVKLTTTNGDVVGTVDAVGLRITRVIDLEGRLVSIPNGNIIIITNSTRLPSRVKISIQVPLRGDISQLRKRVQDTALACAGKAEIHPDSIAVRVEDATSDNATFAIEFQASRAAALSAEGTLREEIISRLQHEGVFPGQTPQQAKAT